MTDYPTPEGERIITTAPMSLQRAREILEAAVSLEGKKQQFPPGIRSGYIGAANAWFRWYEGDDTIKLDGNFTADQLEALAVWLRHHGGK